MGSRCGGSALMDFAGARERCFNVWKHVLFAEKVKKIRLPQQLVGLTTGATQQQRSARRAQPFRLRWAAYSLQLATVKIHMCVVALTASIAACNMELVDDLSAVRHECDTEQILAAPAH